MSDRVKIMLVVNREEREWIHTLAKINHTAIPAMIVDLLDGKSRILGIPIPKHIRRLRSYTQEKNKAVSGKKKFMEKIDRELGLID